MLINTITPAARVRKDECVRVVAPYAGLAALQAQSAPTSAMHGTTVSSYGQLSARAFISLGVAAVAVTTDANPGSPPREAPV